MTLNHQSKFLAHQLGLPSAVSLFMSIFLVSSQQSNNIDDKRPGIPNKKNSNGLPPKTPLTPGTYSKKMNKIVSQATPPNMCLLIPE